MFDCQFGLLGLAWWSPLGLLFKAEPSAVQQDKLSLERLRIVVKAFIAGGASVTPAAVDAISGLLSGADALVLKRLSKN